MTHYSPQELKLPQHDTQVQNYAADILALLEQNLSPLEQGKSLEYVISAMIERTKNAIQSLEHELKTRHAEMECYLNINLPVTNSLTNR